MRRLVLAFFAVGFVACNYNHVKNSGGPGGNTSGVVDLSNLGPTDFATVQTAVIGPRCLSCHSSSGGNQGGTNLESYSNVRSLLNHIANRALVRMDMPPSHPLNEGERKLLQTWVDLGAPEKLTGPAQKPDPVLGQGPADWAKIRDHVFSAKCMDCHSPPAPQANLDLTSLPVVRANAVAIFDRVIMRQDMPVQPYPALTPTERSVLLQWFDTGMPE